MKKEIKIGIQDNGYPIWLKGEISDEELDTLISLLKVMKDNRVKKKLLEKYKEKGWKLEKENNEVLLFSKKLEV